MTSAQGVAPSDPLALEEVGIRRIVESRLAKQHPAFLLMHVECVDQKTGERFEFDLYNEEDVLSLGLEAVDRTEKSWFWQRELLDWSLENNFTIVLKGRQLGVTWVYAGEALWTMLSMPGSAVLCYSINEDEASQLVNRVWDMYESLPDHLKMGTKVLKPARGHRPHTEIELLHPDGRISTITGMASTPKAGRGRTAALIILDEYAFHQWAQSNWKSVIPAVADGARVRIISTANGVSNETTGGGNFYHHLWVNAGTAYKGLKKKFLKWDLHPRRDEEWRANLVMKADQKDEEYPNTAEEAFLLSGRPYFDRTSLKYYASTTREPLLRGFFVEDQNTLPRRAKFEPREDGDVFIFELPVGETVDGGDTVGAHDYAIGADSATGRGTDFSTAGVIDLATGAPVAEIKTKLEPDLFAAQLHYLGKLYNTAIIAPEDQGGYGIPVINALRDGRNGRKAYPRIYRHRRTNRPDQVESTTYGFPMNSGTRPQVVSGLEKWIRDRIFPWVSKGFLAEALTFVHRETGTTPAASEGCNDDLVLCWGIAVELYRRYGKHPDRVRGRSSAPNRKRKSRSSTKAYPWE